MAGLGSDFRADKSSAEGLLCGLCCRMSPQDDCPLGIQSIGAGVQPKEGPQTTRIVLSQTVRCLPKKHLMICADTLVGSLTVGDLIGAL